MLTDKWSGIVAMTLPGQLRADDRILRGSDMVARTTEGSSFSSENRELP
jgi:hypothetical protein